MRRVSWTEGILERKTRRTEAGRRVTIVILLLHQVQHSAPALMAVLERVMGMVMGPQATADF